MPTLAEIKPELIASIEALDPKRSVDWKLIIALAKAKEVDATRQWLQRDEDIYLAYKIAIGRHRKGKRAGRRQKGPPDLLCALDTIDDLRRKVAVRDATISAYDERFLKYLYNARQHNISVEALEAPIPPPSRRTAPGAD